MWLVCSSGSSSSTGSARVGIEVIGRWWVLWWWWLLLLLMVVVCGGSVSIVRLRNAPFHDILYECNIYLIYILYSKGPFIVYNNKTPCIGHFWVSDQMNTDREYRDGRWNVNLSYTHTKHSQVDLILEYRYTVYPGSLWHRSFHFNDHTLHSLNVKYVWLVDTPLRMIYSW